MQGALSAKLFIEFLGLLGPDPAAGHIGELSILNRIVRWRATGAESDGGR